MVTFLPQRFPKQRVKTRKGLKTKKMKMMKKMMRMMMTKKRKKMKKTLLTLLIQLVINVQTQKNVKIFMQNLSSVRQELIQNKKLKKIVQKKF